MAIERERKFLTASDGWRQAIQDVIPMRQAYLAAGADRSIRIRISGEAATLTLKFGGAQMVREEFEYPVPLDDGLAMLRHAVGVEIRKVRHLVPFGELVFEIDVFEGELAGLVLAELEYGEAAAPIPLPAWVGREVTGDARFYNAALCLQGMPDLTA